MEIRRASESDLPAIVEIYNEAIETSLATFDVTPFAVDERRGWFAQFNDENPILVACLDGQIAGYAYYLPYRVKPAYACTKEMTVYVGSAWRRRGIAAALYAALIEHAVQHQVHAILGVIAGDNPASVALHERFGFELVAHLREVGWKFGAWVDTRYYQKILA